VGYDADKDEILEERRIETAEGRWIVAVLARYDGGEKKIGLSRLYAKKDGSENHAKLGRLTLDEVPRIVEAVTALVAEAREQV